MKKFVPFALGALTLAAAAGLDRAIKKHGGIKHSMAKIKASPLVSGAMTKITDLKQRFADNDDSATANAA